MASPILLAAIAAGGYLLYTKMSKGGGGGTRTIVQNAPTVDSRDPVTGTVFTTKLDETFADGTKKVDVFLKNTGTRIVKFLQTGDDKSSRVSLGSPPGTDPSILAAALRLYGIRPKAA